MSKVCIRKSQTGAAPQESDGVFDPSQRLSVDTQDSLILAFAATRKMLVSQKIYRYKLIKSQYSRYLDTPSRPSYRGALAQPSQMGNFKHQSLRSVDRGDRDKDGEKERERDIRDKEGQDRLRHVSFKILSRPSHTEYSPSYPTSMTVIV